MFTEGQAIVILTLSNIGAKAVSGSTKTNHTLHYSYVRCEGDELLLQDCYKISFSLDTGATIYDEATVAGVVCAEAMGTSHTTKISHASNSPQAVASNINSGTSPDPLTVATLAVVCIILFIVLICAV